MMRSSGMINITPHLVVTICRSFGVGGKDLVLHGTGIMFING